MDKPSQTSQNPAAIAAHEDTGAPKTGDTNSQAAETAVAAYLHSLKNPQRNAGSSANATAGPPVSGAPFGVERRRSLRYKCEGSAEYRVEGSEVRTWGALHDISLHGCYVEAPAVSPLGTILNMVLEVNRIRVRLKGEVRVSYPFMGMGIAYTEITEEERARLRKLLLSLSESHTSGARFPTPQSASSSRSIPITDPAALVKSLLQFFQGRTMLSRQDFWELVRKSQPQGG